MADGSDLTTHIATATSLGHVESDVARTIAQIGLSEIDRIEHALADAYAPKVRRSLADLRRTVEALESLCDFVDARGEVH